MKKKILTYSLIILIALIFILFFVFLIIKSPITPVLENNTVVNVIDGDTFEYYDADSESIKIVRLLCVDSPEKNEEGYDEAKLFLESIILDKQIIMTSSITDKDAYGRELRYVYLYDEDDNNLFINKLILEEGHGKLLIIPPEECKELINW